MASNIVLHILGDTSSLTAALASANRQIKSLDSIANTGIKGIVGLGAAFGAMGVAGIAAGAAASAAVVAMTAAIGGALVYFAAKNEDVKKSFTGLKDEFTGGMREIADNLAPALVGLADKANDALEPLFRSFNNIRYMLEPMINEVGNRLQRLASALGPMLQSAFGAGQGPLMAFIGGLEPLLNHLNTFFDILNDPVVTEFTSVLMDSLGQLLPILAELLVNLTPLGTVALPVLVEAFRAFSDIITNTVIPVMSAIGGFLTEHPSLIMALVSAIVAIKVAVMAWQVAQTLLNFTMLASPLTWIVLGIALVIGAIVLLIAHWDTVKEVMAKVWNWIKDQAINIWNGIRDFFVNVWNSITKWISQSVTNIKNAVVNGFNTVKQKVIDILNNVLGFILSLPGRFFQAGADLIRGMINGVGSLAGALVQKARDIASSALSAIKSFFGINSPSRVMRQMGRYVGQGFVQGIDREESAVAKAAKSLGTSALDEVRTAGNSIGGLFEKALNADARMTFDSAVMAGGGTSGPAVININVNAGFSSPEEVGRELVKAIGDFERVNGTRWRE